MTPGRTPEARPPVRAPRAPSPRPLVDIVSGSFGAGHDAAAREIARLLQARGYATRTSDVVDLMPGRLGRRAAGRLPAPGPVGAGHLELAAAGPRDAPRGHPGRRPGPRCRRRRAAVAGRGPAG